MGGVGTLCAVAHCWAALFDSFLTQWGYTSWAKVGYFQSQLDANLKHVIHFF